MKIKKVCHWLDIFEKSKFWTGQICEIFEKNSQKINILGQKSGESLRKCDKCRKNCQKVAQTEPKWLYQIRMTSLGCYFIKNKRVNGQMRISLKKTSPKSVHIIGTDLTFKEKRFFEFCHFQTFEPNFLKFFALNHKW